MDNKIADAGGLQRVLRRDQIAYYTGYCIDHVYDLVKKGEFPAPIPLGPRAVGWLEDEVLEWQKARIAERAQGGREKKIPARTRKFKGFLGGNA